MIRIDAMWLAADPIDMRAGAERALCKSSAQRRRTMATCSRTPAARVSSCWCTTASACGARRAGLNAGRFVWPGTTHTTPLLSLTPAQFDALVLGLPWQRLPELSC
jgi:transposase